MKKAVIVGSLIEIDNQYKLKGVSNRSCFTTQERGVQTAFTLNSIQSHFPDSIIYVLESSFNNMEGYINNPFGNNIIHIRLEDIDPQISHTIRTHHNKSYCEALMFKTFLNVYKEELEQYDFLIKMTGRYWFHPPVNTSYFTYENIGKIFLKKEYIFENSNGDEWCPKDLRINNQPGTIIGNIPTLTFAWGKEFHPRIMEFFDLVLGKSKETYYDVENILYYWIHYNNIPRVEVDWFCVGFGGQNGKFYSY